MMKNILSALVLVGFVAAPVRAQIPVDQVKVVNSPNVLSWPVTTTITRLELRSTGVHAEFTKQNDWPNVTPPGWQGPLQYTLWLFLNIGGDWYASGIIQFWRGLDVNGGDVTANNQIALNWVYDDRWGPMVKHQPAVGERVGFMVSAGNARGQDDHVVAERSNIVEIGFPATAGTVYPPFLWVEGSAPVPVPAPIPAPVPTPTPAPLPSVDLTPILNSLNNIATQIGAVNQNVTEGRAENRAFYTAVGIQWGKVTAFVGKYVAPAITAYLVGKKL